MVATNFINIKKNYKHFGRSSAIATGLNWSLRAILIDKINILRHDYSLSQNGQYN